MSADDPDPAHEGTDPAWTLIYHELPMSTPRAYTIDRAIRAQLARPFVADTAGRWGRPAPGVSSLVYPHAAFHPVADDQEFCGHEANAAWLVRLVTQMGVPLRATCVRGRWTVQLGTLAVSSLSFSNACAESCLDVLTAIDAVIIPRTP